MDAVRHANRIALVTGAGSGIGRATVLRLVQEGAAVIGCDINSDGLDGTRRALDELGMSAELDIADVTQQSDVDRLVAAAGPRIDILANVAGIMDHFLPLGEVDDATWNRVLDVNLTGVMRLSRAVLPVMERSQLAMATMPPVMAQPDAIATVISWLVSDEASNVNGALVSADGGWSAA